MSQVDADKSLIHLQAYTKGLTSPPAPTVECLFSPNLCAAGTHVKKNTFSRLPSANSTVSMNGGANSGTNATISNTSSPSPPEVVVLS